MFIFIFFLLIAILGGANYYLAKRLHRLVHFFVPKLHISVFIAFFAVMTVFMLLSVIRPFKGILGRIASIVGAGWMGIFVYLLLFFLICDLVVLIPKVLKLLSASAMVRLRLISGITATALAISVSVYGFVHAQKIYIKEYNISLSESSTKEMTVAVISDIHLGAVGSQKKLGNAVEKINSLNADLVCIAGDFFDNDYSAIENIQQAINTVKGIKSKYGVYACYGNHDSGKSFSDMEDFFKKANVTVLKDSYRVIDNSFILAGRLDTSPINATGNLKRGELSKLLSDADKKLPVVMLDHNPMSINTYNGKVALLISGHTHKGQIFPGSIITGGMYTVDYGYYKGKDGIQAIVTSGVGTWGPPMRVGTNSEIVKINLEY